jgi:hypothetical protein
LTDASARRYGVGMRCLLRASTVAVALATSAVASAGFAGEPLLVVHETRAQPSGGARRGVERIATIRNTSPRAVRAVRVTVEAHDRSGKILWKTVKRGPSSLRPGESAALSVTTPDLGPDATFVYHIDSGAERRRPRSR